LALNGSLFYSFFGVVPTKGVLIRFTSGLCGLVSLEFLLFCALHLLVGSLWEVGKIEV